MFVGCCQTVIFLAGCLESKLLTTACFFLVYTLDCTLPFSSWQICTAFLFFGTIHQEVLNFLWACNLPVKQQTLERRSEKDELYKQQQLSRYIYTQLELGFSRENKYRQEKLFSLYWTVFRALICSSCSYQRCTSQCAKSTATPKRSRHSQRPSRQQRDLQQS